MKLRNRAYGVSVKTSIDVLFELYAVLEVAHLTIRDMDSRWRDCLSRIERYYQEGVLNYEQYSKLKGNYDVLFMINEDAKLRNKAEKGGERVLNAYNDYLWACYHGEEEDDKEDKGKVRNYFAEWVAFMYKKKGVFDNEFYDDILNFLWQSKELWAIFYEFGWEGEFPVRRQKDPTLLGWQTCLKCRGYIDYGRVMKNKWEEAGLEAGERVYG